MQALSLRHTVIDHAGVAAEDGTAALNLTKPYARPGGATTAEQRASVQGRPCVDCGATADTQVAAHIDPLVKEYSRTGSIVDGVRDGVPMRVIIEPGGEGIITGFPLP